MATQKLYPLWKVGLVTAASGTSLNGTTTTAPFVSLVDTGTYTYSDSHSVFSDLSGIQGTDQPLTTPTNTSGSSGSTFDADDVTFTAVTGVSIEALVIYRASSGIGTGKLVYYTDINVTGLPVTPNGGNISIVWSGSGIFTL